VAYEVSPLLSTLSSRWDDELAVDLAVSVESHGDPTAAQQALEEQIRSARNVRYDLWWAAELMMAGLRVGVHPIVINSRSLQQISHERTRNARGGLAET